MMGVEPHVAGMTRTMIIYMLPAGLARILGEASKSWFSGIDFIREIGITYMVNFFLFLGYASFLIGYLKLDMAGYALSIFIYEATGLVVCTYFFVQKVPKELKNTEIPINTNIFWYLKECLKIVGGNYPNAIVYDTIIVLVTTTHDPYQIATFSLIGNFPDVLALVFTGIWAFPRAQINEKLGIKDWSGAYADYKKYFIFTIIVALPILLVVNRTVIWSIGGSVETNKISFWVNKCFLWTTYVALFKIIYCYLRIIMISLEMKGKLLVSNFTASAILRSLGSYICIVKLGMGVYGYWVNETFVTILRGFLCFVFIKMKDWTTVVGVRVKSVSSTEGGSGEIVEEKKQESPDLEMGFLEAEA